MKNLKFTIITFYQFKKINDPEEYKRIVDTLH